ncbi:MAG: LdpA C-terminal domain-containing domain [Phormidesmis sp.]
MVEIRANTSADVSLSPLESLQAGHWFKLICGASYQSLPAVRNLTLAYALAGADCIDVAADLAVVAAAKEGLSAARRLVRHAPNWQKNTHQKNVWQRNSRWRQPWLMVSMSAGVDPHFRKAWFDAEKCPSDCSRPCEDVCPAIAIDSTGVIRDRCYGCGRCLPVCPLGLIEARSQPTTLDAIAQSVVSQVDALEIHTHVGNEAAFKQLWQTITPWISHLKLISISCPDGENFIAYLQSLQRIMGWVEPTVRLHKPQPALVWQTDGRPMSGDIGKGTTHAAVRLAQKVIASEIPGYVQLAGGTNEYTVLKLREMGLLQCSNEDFMRPRAVSGIAYGSFARRLLMPVIDQTYYLEEVPKALHRAVSLAESLVAPLKSLVE